MDSATPCKVQNPQCRESCGKESDTRRRIHRGNLRESVWKELCSKIMKIALQERCQFIKSIQYCAQVRSLAPSIENSICQSRRGQRMAKAREIASMANDQSQEQKRDCSGSTIKRKYQSILLRWWTSVISKFGVGTQIPKLWRSSRSPRWHCERWFRLRRCVHRTGFVSISNDGRKK